jgi:membrane-associated phospholipid phosphatase
MLESMKPLLLAITEIGDTAVMTALAAIIALYLFWAGSRKSAGLLVLSLLAAAGAIFILKIAFLGCWVKVPFFDLRSPSGHAALSAAVLGTFASIMATQLGGTDRWIPYLVVGPLIVLIAASRTLLGMHTPEEALVGLFVGFCVAVAAYVILDHSNVPKLDLRLIAILGIVVIVIFHGTWPSFEPYVKRIAAWLSGC